jgi:hypothetical protein
MRNVPVVLSALVLAAATSGARAATRLDMAGGTLVILGEGLVGPMELKAAALPWARLEVLSAPGAAPVIDASTSAAGIALLATRAGGEIISDFVFAGGEPVPNPPYALRDPATGVATLPSLVRTITLSPGASLLSAGHVVLPATDEVRGVAFVREASGAVVLLDYEYNTGAVPRRTSLGLSAPLGSTRGSVVAAADGRAWATFASSDGIRLFELGDLSGPGPLAPTLLASAAVTATFNPTLTLRAGIIAVLIGLVAEPRPFVSFQDGDTLRLLVHDGGELRPVAEQVLPPGTQGLLCDDGLFYFFKSEGTVWKGAVGGGAPTVVR